MLNRDKFYMWLAFKLPRHLVYWAVVRAAAPFNYPGDVKAVDMLKEWS